MKYILAILIVTALPAWADEVCGFYQIENFGDRVLYSITRFSEQKSYRGQTTYTITNPGGEEARTLLRGMCYCVSGVVLEDPEFIGDESYRLMTISRVESGPYSGCIPGSAGLPGSK